MNSQDTHLKIERLMDELNAKALSGSVSEEHIRPNLSIMLDGVERRCVAERERYRHVTGLRQQAFSAMLCLVIALSTFFTLPHTDRSAFVIDQNLANHTETINGINALFTK